jgi:cell division protein FtsB
MRRLLPILVVLFLVASLLIYFFGDSGLLAYRDLDIYRQHLAANVENLQQRSMALQAELTSIKDDPERTKVMARRIGFYGPGDEVVKLEGLPPRVERYAVGDLLKLKKGNEAKSAVVKAIAVCLSALFGVSALLAARTARRKVHDRQGG